jgi:hypothetical protein
MLCYGIPNKWSPLAVLRFPAQMSLHHVVQTGHKVCHKIWCHSHSIEHDTQPIAYLSSKQAVSYQTRGGTCCPVVSTPKIQSLADSSMTNHNTWQNSTVSTIPILHKQQHRFSPWSNHISMDGRPSLTKTQAVASGFKAKTRCSSYVCPGSSCHIYDQYVNIENQYLYYINIITRDIVFTQKTKSTLSSSSSGTHQSHRQSTGGNTRL